MMERFYRLTEDEFLLLSPGTIKDNMLMHKFIISDADLVDWLEENARFNYCAVPDGSNHIVFFNSPHSGAVEDLKAEYREVNHA
jgi:hypothetical protein